MTMLDIAQSLRGKLRDGASAVQSGGAPESKSVRFGVAQSDSSGGFVDILLDNSPTTEPGYSAADYTFSVACDSPIKANDRVSYVVIDGVGKAISLGTVSSMAEATSQHFWTDASGAHVGTVANSTTSGQSATLNSSGLTFKDANDVLAVFGPTQVEIAKNCELSEVGDSVGTVGIALLNRGDISLIYKKLDVAGVSTISRVPQMVLETDGGYVVIHHLGADGATINADALCLGGEWRNNFPGVAATLTNSAAGSTTSTLAKVTLGASIVQSDGSLFSKSSNGIKCSAAGTVLVSGQVYCQSMGSSNNLAVDIYQNSASICEAVSSCGSGGLCTVSIPPRAVTVAANDVIYLYVKSTNAVTNGIPVGGAALTVQYI